MGYVKEPEGVDFIIEGKPLTDEQKQTISDFIKVDRLRSASPKRADTGLTRRPKPAKSNG